MFSTVQVFRIDQKVVSKLNFTPQPLPSSQIFLNLSKIENMKLREYTLLSLNWTDKVWTPELTLIHKNIRSVRNSHAHDVTDKNNNVSYTGLDKHYHKYHGSSHRTWWDISDNVGLNLQNCHYSIYLSNEPTINHCPQNLLYWHTRSSRHLFGFHISGTI